MKKIIFITAIILLCLSGCVSKKNLQINENISQLKNKKLAYITRKSYLEVTTPGKAVISSFFKDGSYTKNLLTNLYNDSNGDFSIANYLSVTLAKELSAKYNLKLLKENKQNIPEYDMEDFISKFSDSNYIIDNYVTDWRVMYYKLKFNKYYISLTTKMRLIDTKNKKIISEGFCQEETQYNEKHPLTYDLLFKNNAKGLIEESKKLSDICLNKYRKLLKIY